MTISSVKELNVGVSKLQLQISRSLSKKETAAANNHYFNLLFEVCMYRNIIVYIGFSTISFRYPLRILKNNPMNKGQLLYQYQKQLNTVCWLKTDH